MMNNDLFFFNIYRPLPVDYDIPPTIYSILNSYVNFDKETKTKIKDLAKEGREVIFDFDYPLTDNVTKEDFECMILNNFLMRRIGYDTVTAFKIALMVKLNEIMPKYNKLFDSMIGWDLFNDGENITRNKNNTASSTASTTGSGSNISDRRYSDTPQNALQDVRDGRYVTDYNYDTDTSSTTTSANDSTTGSETEVINRSNSDKNNLYKIFSTEINNVYTLIFKDLDELFYGLA